MNRANYLLVLLVSLVVWLILLEAGRGLRHLTRGLAAVALRFVPKEAAKVASLVVVFALAIFVVNGALYNGSSLLRTGVSPARTTTRPMVSTSL